MLFVVGCLPDPAARVGILAGAFNPPTLAHQALLSAGSRTVDRTVCVLPREYPHKSFFGATLDERIAMLAQLGNTVAIADQGLFIDIAREFRRDIAPKADLHFLCGRDTAERIVTWDYAGTAPPIAEQLQEYKLLVARRGGEYLPPPGLAARVGALDIEQDWEDVSSTRVREWLAQGDPRWRTLIPEAIADEVARIYTR
jgi:nicotinic acid mononucleotide adenylyltransferase